MRYRYRPSGITLSATLTIAALLVMTLDIARPSFLPFEGVKAIFFKERTLRSAGLSEQFSPRSRPHPTYMTPAP